MKGFRLLFDMDNSAFYSSPTYSADLPSSICLPLKKSVSGSRPEPVMYFSDGLWYGVFFPRNGNESFKKWRPHREKAGILFFKNSVIQFPMSKNRTCHRVTERVN